jgi:hypothetical protein
MPNSKEPVYSNLELFRAALDPAYKPKAMTASELMEAEEVRKFRMLWEIRCRYKWEWNAGAKYLFSEVIRAYGLEGEWRDRLIEWSKAKPGRKHAVLTALRVAELKQEGKSAKQIAEQLGISTEAVESYSKRRREPSVEEQARAAVKRAFGKLKKPR